MMLLGSVLTFADRALNVRFNTRLTHGTNPNSESSSINIALGSISRAGLV